MAFFYILIFKGNRNLPNMINNSRVLKCFVDGGSRNNPGYSACGLVINNENDETLYEEGIFLGIKTNNQAEYLGLVYLLQKLPKFSDAKQITIHSDSQLVVHQVNTLVVPEYSPTFKCNVPELKKFRDECALTISGYQRLGIRIKLVLIKRELNSHADRLVNEVLDKTLQEVRKSIS